ncbi:putative trypsin-like serine protease [Actinoplanes missouriensis 431]|uniref:Putative trypsin-like serine protease n=2 Tax=Actinoplanes missouriensis TaxID=1866 RepID=I0H4B2_ACTM4|nr:putative trypsin-like serine protease [Actinoplanes missouriensis 431]
MMRRLVTAAGAAVLIAAAAPPAPAAAVTGGTAVTSGYGFVAEIRAADGTRGCSGALVDPEWVVTSADCVPADLPATSLRITVGRTDRAAAGTGQVRAATETVRHPSRGIVLAKLATPITDIAPVPFGTTAPVVGETLTVAGYGRTGTDWVPDQLHVADLRVQSVATGRLGLTGAPAALCAGDTGGPALRVTGNAVALVALHSASWQGGCLETEATETRSTTTETRLDDVAAWARETIRGGAFVRLPTSGQVLDTRSGLGGGPAAPAARSITTFQVAGVAGVPAGGVSAVLLDLTAISATGNYLTVFPEGGTRDPALSMLNTSEQTLSNTVVVPLPASGRLSVYNNTGGHMLADVQGYYVRGAGAGFVPVAPTWLVDTRNGTGGSTGTIPGNGSRTFTLTGGVVPVGATAVFADVIAVGATGPGWLAAAPPGVAANRSVMDYVAGNTAHGVAIQLGSDGRVTITNRGYAIHLVLTVTGYYVPGSGTAGLRTLTARRLLDTRISGTGTPVAAQGTADISTGLPAGATAVLNLTSVANTQSGHLHAWPVGGAEPAPSFANYAPPGSGARSALATVPVGTDGRIRLRNVSSGTAHLLADLQGWYAPGGPAPSGAPAGPVAAVPAPSGEAPTETNGGTLVEDYRYPGAATIEATQHISLGRGDGHILLADCGAGTPAADLIVVETHDAGLGFPRFCFKARGTAGVLTLDLPKTFLVRADAGRALAATSRSATGTTTVTVGAGQYRGVGIGEEGGAESALVELRYPPS